MDESRKPRSRQKKVVNEGRGVEKYGEGLGTGPVGSTGSHAGQQQAGSARPASAPRQTGTPQSQPSPFTQSRPQQTGSARPMNSPGSTQRPQSNPFGQARPQGQQNPFGQTRPQGQQNPFTQSRPQQSGSARPMGTPTGSSQSRPQGQQSPFTQSRPQQSGSARPGGGSQRAGGGGGGKLILIIIAALALLGGGGSLSGLFGGLTGGGNDTPLPAGNPSGYTSSSSSGSTSSLLDNLLGGDTGSSGSSGSSMLDRLLGGSTGSTTSSSTGTSSSPEIILGAPVSSSSSLTDLLSAFMGSSGSSVYDFSGDPASLLTGGSSSGVSSGTSSGSTAVSSSSGSGGTALDTSVSKKARAKYTTIKGNKKDEVTILVYLCGADLESRNGMATSDLKEMTQATLGKNINLIVYTGGCRRWRNNVVSSSVNQIYQIQDGKLYCLEKDMGSVAMTNPATLTKFIQYGAENFPANRMCLIFWDHGGGSVTGYGHDEKFTSAGSMSLAGINTALKNAGQKFDFIGFDTCLMATVENGIMLSQYADYMIASEETEPGVGWYYTNWLSQLGKNTSTPTVEIGKQIVDDFVNVCARQCRGQGTTLSVVDLAELQATVPSELTSFSRATNELIQNQEYKTVSSARSRTREFAQSTRIDQIDLVHFANNLGTKEAKSLAKALQGAIKYNRTGGSISNAYGLSIYFPYKRTNKVSQMVSTYEAIGMDEEYARCIQEFASLELSGQAAAGTPMTGYSSDTIGMPSLLNSLLGGYGGAGSSFSGYPGGYSGSISSSSDELSDLLGGLFSGGSLGGGSSSGMGGDLLSLFSGRSLTAEKAASYLSTHHLDTSALVWDGNRITLSHDQWNEVESLAKNVFVDDGKGFIDLGMDNQFTIEGNDLVDDFDGTALSIGGQPISYHYLADMGDDDDWVTTGFSPALLNGVRVNLMIRFDSEHPFGVIAGAEPVYPDGETEAQAKNLIAIGEGDELQFLCDYYDYEGNYQNSYHLGKPVILSADTEIANTPIGNHPTRVTYCFTDYYQQRYWTPARDYGR